MRMALLPLLLLLLPGLASANDKKAQENEDALNRRAFEFFQKHGEQKVNQFTYNPYESLISGMAAIVIGNVGYLTTESSSLKLTYSAIQTIGIVNIGQGIYQAQAPAVDNSLRGIFTDEKMKVFTREKLAGRLLRVFAQEDRAKRLSLFYGSSFLTIQYAMNATIYKSSGQLKKIYLFLGGVNAIVAIYSAFSKSQYEEAYYGNKLDISPFVSLDDHRQPSYGLLVGARF